MPRWRSRTCASHRTVSGPRRRPWGTLIACLLVLPGLALALGQLLHGQPAGLGLVDSLRQITAHAGDYLHANGRFALWQLMGPWGGPWPCPEGHVCSPRWALVWDLPFIGCYSAVLAWFAVRAFGLAAGLQRLNDPVPKLLNRLGWALPLMVAADLAENACTWTALTLMAVDANALAVLARCAMAVCAAVKWLGLAGTLWLIIQGHHGRTFRIGRLHTA